MLRPLVGCASLLCFATLRSVDKGVKTLWIGLSFMQNQHEIMIVGTADQHKNNVKLCEYASDKGPVYSLYEANNPTFQTMR